VVAGASSATRKARGSRVVVDSMPDVWWAIVEDLPVIERLLNVAPHQAIEITRMIEGPYDLKAAH
jgi:hypothetical protein